MKLLNKNRVLFLMMWCVSICSGQEHSDMDKVSSQEVLLYIIRGGCPDLSTVCRITIDNVEVGSLGRKEFLKVYVKPGLHSIDAIWPAWCAGSADEYTQRFIGGRTYYLATIYSTVTSLKGFLVSHFRGSPVRFLETQGDTEEDLFHRGYVMRPIAKGVREKAPP